MTESIGHKSAGAVLDAAKQTGIDIVHEGEAIFWQGQYGGQTKPRGPLSGKKVACIVGSEFSDFQAYYLASYIGEFGGEDFEDIELAVPVMEYIYRIAAPKSPWQPSRRLCDRARRWSDWISFRAISECRYRFRKYPKTSTLSRSWSM